MTAENGIRTENKMKRLAAALGVALAAMLAAASLSPARADAVGTSDGNLVIDVPTTVPCALMADGTVVSPSEWNITTSGGAYIASASASGLPANVEWSAKTTDLAAAQAGSVRVSGTGDAASVSGPSDPASATLAGTARFEWSFSKLDAGKNSDIIAKAAGGTAVLGSVTFTFSKPASAFAVYSADDNSLTFYKRASVPAAGEQFEGKAATEVYEGVEDASYTAADGAPWADHAAELASVTVADAGISPVSTAYWFNGSSKLRSVSLAGLDTSKTTCMDGMFQGCSSLESLDLSAMSTRRAASMTAFLGGCDSLAELSIGSEFAWVGDDCYPPTGNWKQGSTGNDYSESDIPANKTDKYTRTKTAFAVYSADDRSLTFYKRFEVPANGAQFLGKTATKVYTGFETKTYASAGRVPWSAYASSINAVTTADEGVAPVSTSCWFYSFTKVKSFDLSKLDTRKVTNMSSMFYNCTALTTLNLSSFDTANVTDMGYMFYGCSALTALDLSSFDTQNATNMSMMFNNCGALTALDVSSFDTRNVVSMYGMFDRCKALTALDISSFDTGNVTNMGIMFEGCSALTSLDVSSFHTGNVKDMNRMFSNCFRLTSLDLSSFDTRNVSSMYSMFSNCFRLTSLDLSSFDASNVKDMSEMFSGCSALTSLDLSSLNTSNVTNMGGMFEGCSSLRSLDVSSFDTHNVTGMSYMFNGCKALTTLDLSSFDTRNVKYMKDMFYGCTALQKVTFGAGWKWVGTNGYLPTPSGAYIAGADGKWYDTDGNGYAPADIPSNKAMTYTAIAPKKTAFAVYSADDNSLTFYNRLDVPAEGAQFLGKAVTGVYTGVESTAGSVPWAGHATDIASVAVADEGIAPVSTAHWFFGMAGLESVDISKLDTSNVTSMYRMFMNCSALTSLDLSSFETGKVTDMLGLFDGCRALKALDVSTFDTRSVTDMRSMFDNCNALTSLDLSSFDTNNVTNISYMFMNCSALTSLDLSSFETGKVTKMSGLFSGCKALTSLDLSSFDTSNVTEMLMFLWNCNSLEKITLGAGFKWIGDYCYPRTGNWESVSTGKAYSEYQIPTGTADTYAYKSGVTTYAATREVADPAASETAAAIAAVCTCDAQGESATQKAVEGVSPLEEKAAKERDVATEPEGAEENGAVKGGE